MSRQSTSEQIIKGLSCLVTRLESVSMADKRGTERKKPTIKDAIWSKVQSLSRSIPNPFRTQSPVRFTDEDSLEESSMSVKSKKTGIQSPGFKAKKGPLASGSFDNAKGPASQSVRKSVQVSSDTPQSLVRPPTVSRPPTTPFPKQPNSGDKFQKTQKSTRRRQKKLNKDQKLREEVAGLTNELARLQAYDESNELDQSYQMASEDLKVVEKMFKGARETVRSQFKHLAEEVYADKGQNWELMATLERTVGKAIEEQKRLSSSLDAIIEEVERMAKPQKDEEADGSSLPTVLSVGCLLLVFVAFLVYRRCT